MPTLTPYRNPLLRRFAWRLGRRLYCWARGEGRNHMEGNGELALQDWLLSLRLPGTLCCLDIGANIGDWSASLVAKSQVREQALTIHAFEATPATHGVLEQRFSRSTYPQVHAHNLAMSSEPGSVLIHVLGPSLGRNSLFRPMGSEATTPVSVQATSIDAFMEEQDIPLLHMVKCDTEGHDPLVLKGATKALSNGRILLFQFEYNERWIQANSHLWNVFAFMESLPYQLGRLGPTGIEWIEAWHPELDRFFEANYVLAHDSVVAQLPGQHSHFDCYNTLCIMKG